MPATRLDALRAPAANYIPKPSQSATSSEITAQLQTAYSTNRVNAGYITNGAETAPAPAAPRPYVNTVRRYAAVGNIAA